MENWREVTQDEFFASIGKRDCHPKIQPGPYPWTSHFETPHREVLGKAVGYVPEDSGLEATRYYLPK